MKKTSRIAFTLVVFSICLYNCKTTTPITEKTNAEEVELPFTSKEFRTDKENFRASQTGLSPDLATSKKIALQNAKTELASNVQTTIKAVTDNYTNQRTFNDRQEFENKFEELSRQVTNQQLTNVKIIGEKSFIEADGRYRYYIAIEMSMDAMKNQLYKGISNDEKLQLDFDKYLFEKVLNEEMEKFENQ